MRLFKVTVAGKFPIRNSILQWFQCTLAGISRPLPLEHRNQSFWIAFFHSLLKSKVLGINTPARCSSPVAANNLHQKLGEFFGWIGLFPRALPQLSAAA